MTLEEQDVRLSIVWPTLVVRRQPYTLPYIAGIVASYVVIALIPLWGLPEAMAMIPRRRVY